VVETARYGRVSGLEQPEPGFTPGYLLHCLDRVMRYTTSTSRALYKVIEELTDCRRHGKLAKNLPLPQIPNRPNDLLNSTKGNPRSRPRTRFERQPCF